MIISFAGQKGGVGKSTLSISISISVACELMRRGHSVLLVDADHEQGTTRTFADVATEAGVAAPTVIAMGANLYQQLPGLAAKYDYTIIDCPPRHSNVTRAALMTSDVSLLPVSGNPAEVWAMAESIDLVAQATNLRPELKAAIVINRKDSRTALGKGAFDALAPSGLRIMATTISNRVAFAETIAAGKGVTAYAPKDQAAEEIRALVSEILTLASPVAVSLEVVHA